MTPFLGPQPWEAPDPLPVMRRELKLLLIEMNLLRIEVEQSRSIREEAQAREAFFSASVKQLTEGRDKWRREAERLRDLIEQGPCLYRKLDSAIMMMKSAEDRPRCDAAYVLDGAMDRSVFAKRPMSPRLIIISGILRQNPA